MLERGFTVRPEHENVTALKQAVTLFTMEITADCGGICYCVCGVKPGRLPNRERWLDSVTNQTRPPKISEEAIPVRVIEHGVFCHHVSYKRMLSTVNGVRNVGYHRWTPIFHRCRFIFTVVQVLGVHALLEGSYVSWCVRKKATSCDI